ncbi:hypothetical protein [Herbidospora cretacea]|uniref:hypothetical protein n=1 Tax=Herbidospora cretacea TaxID=28444 RepID=UPI0004C2DAFC|nr:hypothetical protein [Herbidospora cretacea]
MIRVLVADDQEDIRGAFRINLDAQPDMTVAAEAACGASAAEQARHLRRGPGRRATSGARRESFTPGRR